MKGRGIKPGQVGLKIDYLFEREKFFAKNYTGVRGHFYYENKNEPDFLYGSRLFEAVLRENYKDVLMLIIKKIRDRYDLTMSLKDDPDADEKFSVMENYCLYPAVTHFISEPFGIHFEAKDGPLAKKHFNASTEIAQNSKGDEYIGFTRYLGDALTKCGIQLPAEFGMYMLDKQIVYVSRAISNKLLTVS